MRCAVSVASAMPLALSARCCAVLDGCFGAVSAARVSVAAAMPISAVLARCAMRSTITRTPSTGDDRRFCAEPRLFDLGRQALSGAARTLDHLPVIAVARAVVQRLAMAD